MMATSGREKEDEEPVAPMTDVLGGGGGGGGGTASPAGEVAMSMAVEEGVPIASGGATDVVSSTPAPATSDL